MEGLNLTEFETVFVSLITENSALEDYEFIELPDRLKIKSPKGAEVELVYEGLYKMYTNENKDIHSIAEDALAMIVESMKVQEEKLSIKTDCSYDINEFINHILHLDMDDLNLDEEKEKEKEPEKSVEKESFVSDNIKDILGVIENIFDNNELERKELLSSVNVFLVNKKYENLYSDYVYSEVLDMLLVYHVGALDSSEDVLGGCIPKNTLDELDINMAELNRCAMENMENAYPVKMYDAPGNGVILTNKSSKYGASAILYSGVLKDIAEKNDSDLFVIPLSMDAFYVVPDKGNRDKLLRKIEMLMNKQENYILSDKIVKYNKENDNLYL